MKFVELTIAPMNKKVIGTEWGVIVSLCTSAIAIQAIVTIIAISIIIITMAVQQQS